MEKKFEVGDKVKCVDNGCCSKNLKGKYGIIKRVNLYDYSVEFFDYIGGHTCNGVTKDGYGWNCNSEMLELAKNETIVIYRKDNQVIALDKTTGEKYIARCNPEDTFDFYVGANIAFNRLLGDENKEPIKTPLNTKIVFTKGDDTFKTGHIYEITNGKINDPDTGNLFPLGRYFQSIDDVRDYFSSTNTGDSRWNKSKSLEFIEVKED